MIEKEISGIEKEISRQGSRIESKISNQGTLLTVIAILVAITAVAFVSNVIVEQKAISRFNPKINVTDVTKAKAQREIDKLTAEVQQIRSETAGGLFWLKLLGGFVTVGGAVGGYLIAQKETNKERLEFEERKEQKRLEFEHRKDIDAAYQAIVQELTIPDRPLLRAAAAMKLGALLQNFPSEWDVSQRRIEELIHQTKQVLAIALATETEPKVRKALTIAIAQDSNLKELDLSGAQATNAYWAKKDFTDADFFEADLSQASLRKSNLYRAQFRSANLQEAVLAEANCVKTNFKLADLSHADLSHTDMSEAIFEKTNIQGADLRGAQNLSVDQVKSAQNWEQARYDENFRIKLGL